MYNLLGSWAMGVRKRMCHWHSQINCKPGGYSRIHTGFIHFGSYSLFDLVSTLITPWVTWFVGPIRSRVQSLFTRDAHRCRETVVNSRENIEEWDTHMQNALSMYDIGHSLLYVELCKACAHGRKKSECVWCALSAAKSFSCARTAEKWTSRFMHVLHGR